MTWFEGLTGFREMGPNQVRKNITVDGPTLVSNVNGNVMVWGRLETPTLADLRELVQSGERGSGKMTVREVVADAQVLHTDTANSGSLFQVASQFNLLEMASPNVTPEHGVGIYENDHTQGPACAIAAGAGTIYRNYFVPINDQTGQTESNQIDCLADIGKSLGNSDNSLWQMRNGYALPSKSGLIDISNLLQALREDELDELRKLLRIGVQWDTQVTLNNSSHLVSQAHCSALPVAYSSHSSDLWQHFARLVLEASYEAVICAAVLNQESTGNNSVYLTLLGGGAFGNETDWIIGSIRRALMIYARHNIDVAIVSHGSSKPHVQQLVSQFS